jgi:GT2 family glycosyltransferase
VSLIDSRNGAGLPSLCVIIVSWNGRDLLQDCLDSLADGGYRPLRLILVDNDSRDDSVAFVRRSYPQVEVLTASENLRWAGGNNLALELLKREGWPQEQVLLLNNDTIVPPGCLEKLAAALRDEPGAWAATPRILYAHDPSRIWYDGGVAGAWSGWVRHAGIRQAADRRPHDNRLVDYGTGCALLLTRKALQCCGHLDTSFHFYGEDVDYCLRMRAAGGRILHVPGASLLHKVSATLGSTSPKKIYLRSRSHFQLLRRHWPCCRRPLLLPLQVCFLGGHTLWHFASGRPATAWALWRGVFDEWRRRPLPEAYMDTVSDPVVS